MDKESFGKVRIFEEVEQRMRHRAINFLSSMINPSENEASWDGKIACVQTTPLSSPTKSRDEISVRGGGFVTAQICGCVSNARRCVKIKTFLTSCSF